MAEMRKIMLRRVLAWILLIGFIFIIVDIVFIGFMRSLFAALYVVMVFAFFFIKPRNGND